MFFGDKELLSSSWDFVRGPTSILVLLELATAFGLEESDCLQGTNIKRHELDNPECLLNAEEELKVIRNLQERLVSCVGLSFEAGLRIQFTEYGLFGMTMMACTTIEQLLETSLRFRELSWVYCDLSLEQSTDELLLIADDTQLPEELREFLFLRDLGVLFSVQRTILPSEKNLWRVELKMPYSKGLDPYLDVIGDDVKFGQPRNIFAVKKYFSSIKLPHGNPSAYKRWANECEKILSERRQLYGTTGHIRRMLREGDNCAQNMEAIAHSLGMHPRELRRRLKSENQTFQHLLEEHRRVTAEELLSTTKLQIADIAEQLGYSESACFTRAFKRWTGKSPKQYRKLGK